MSESILKPLEAAFDYGQGLQRRGLGYVLASDPGDQPPWRVAVNRLRASGGELRGELTVQVGGRHVSAGTFNVSSLTARATTARLLAARAPKSPWAEILERLCVSVLAAEGAGEPAEIIGRRREVVEEPRMLPPLLPTGHASVIYGPGGAGKSTLAAAIAVSVSAGAEVIPGWKPPAAKPVLILDWESTAADWTNLLASIAEGAGLEPVKVAYRACSRPLADDVEKIAELAGGVGAGLVLVDSVGLALGIGRDVGDPADGVLRLHQALRHLHNTSMLVDHVAGADNGQGTGTSKPYGSVYKINVARDVWELRREQDPRDGVAEVLLLNAKVNVGAKQAPIGLRIVYDRDVIRFERGEVSAPELASRLSTRSRMHQALTGGAMTTAMLAEQLGISDGAVRVAINRDAKSDHPQFVRLGDRIGLSA